MAVTYLQPIPALTGKPGEAFVKEAEKNLTAKIRLSKYEKDLIRQVVRNNR